MNKTRVEQPTLEISAQIEEVELLRKEREKLREEALKLADQRNRLNENFNALKMETKTYKDRRDELNKKVQELKTKKKLIRDKISARLSEARNLREKLHLLDKKIGRNYSGTAEKIRELEWTIQTSSLSASEEKQLINQIKMLESQRSVQKNVREMEGKLIELNAEVGALRIEENKVKQEMSRPVEESGLLHKKVLELAKETSEVKDKADEMHSAYLEAKGRADEAHSKYLKSMIKLKKLKEESRESAKLRNSEYRRIMKEKAKDKLKKGQKLSFVEFTALAEEEVGKAVSG